VDPGEVEEAFRGLHVPGSAVPLVCPWPGAAAVGQGLQAGQLFVMRDDDLFRAVITAEAREALAHGPRWPHSRFDPHRELATEAARATRHAVLTQFAAYLAGGEWGNLTALAMMRLQPLAPYVVVTLWSQVREQALAADRAFWAWVDAGRAAGRDPIDTP
jgi:hypothetical protein